MAVKRVLRDLILQILNETSTMSVPEIPEQATTLLGKTLSRTCFHRGL